MKTLKEGGGYLGHETNKAIIGPNKGKTFGFRLLRKKTLLGGRGKAPRKEGGTEDGKDREPVQNKIKKSPSEESLREKAF